MRRTGWGRYFHQEPCLAVLLLAMALVCGSYPVAASAEIDCDTLLEKGLRPGEIPMVSIDPSTGSIILETRSGICREAIAIWTARNVPPEFFSGAGSGTPAKAGSEAPAKIEKDEAPPRVVPARPRPAEPVKPFETHPLFRPPPVAPAEVEPAGKSVGAQDAIDPSAATDGPEAEKRSTLFEAPDLNREFEIKKAARSAPAEEPTEDWLGTAILGAVGSTLVLVGGAAALYLVRRKRIVKKEVQSFEVLSRPHV